MFDLPLGLVPCCHPLHSAIPASGHRELQAEKKPAPGPGTDPLFLQSVVLPGKPPAHKQSAMVGGAAWSWGKRLFQIKKALKSLDHINGQNALVLNEEDFQGSGGESSERRDLYLTLLLNTRTLNRAMEQEGIFHNTMIHMFHKMRQAIHLPLPSEVPIIKTRYPEIKWLSPGGEEGVWQRLL